MYNVIICCESPSSLYGQLTAIRHYLETPTFAGSGQDQPLNLLETGRISRLSGPDPILILPKPLSGEISCPGHVFAVIANSDFYDAGALAEGFPGAQILTCGMHQQDALTFSSCDGEQAVISLQAPLFALSGSPVLPQEIPLTRREEIKRFDLLACAALMLLCGRAGQLPEILS